MYSPVNRRAEHGTDVMCHVNCDVPKLKLGTSFVFDAQKKQRHIRFEAFFPHIMYVMA